MRQQIQYYCQPLSFRDVLYCFVFVQACVCVCIWTDTDQHHAHSSIHTHVHYKYMTPFRTLWRELLIAALGLVQNIVGIFSKPFPFVNLYAIISNALQHIPNTFPWLFFPRGQLAPRAHMLKATVFLLPTSQEFYSDTRHASLGTSVPTPPSHLQKSLTVPKCCCYFLPFSKQKNDVF